MFDGWKLFIEGKSISIKQCKEINLCDRKNLLNEDCFLQQDFNDFQISKLNIDVTYISVLEQRIEEIKNSFNAHAYLAVILLAGSTLEGLLLMLAIKHQKEFFSCKKVPKSKDGNIKPLTSWKLCELIDIACEQKFIDEDVKKFSHALRDFRNYIHPMQQYKSQFFPDEHTAKICLQVLKATIFQMQKKSLSVLGESQVIPYRG